MNGTSIRGSTFARARTASSILCLLSVLAITTVLTGSAYAITQVDNTSNALNCDLTIYNDIWAATSFTTGSDTYTLDSVTSYAFNIAPGNGDLP